jgi:hypothetical protein
MGEGADCPMREEASFGSDTKRPGVDAEWRRPVCISTASVR